MVPHIIGRYRGAKFHKEKQRVLTLITMAHRTLKTNLNSTFLQFCMQYATYYMENIQNSMDLELLALPWPVAGKLSQTVRPSVVTWCVYNAYMYRYNMVYVLISICWHLEGKISSNRSKGASTYFPVCRYSNTRRSRVGLRLIAGNNYIYLKCIIAIMCSVLGTIGRRNYYRIENSRACVCNFFLFISYFSSFQFCTSASVVQLFFFICHFIVQQKQNDYKYNYVFTFAQTKERCRWKRPAHRSSITENVVRVFVHA